MVSATIAPAPETVPFPFLLGKTLPAVQEKEFMVIELCTATGKITHTTEFRTVIGSQRLGSFWQIYCKDMNARIELLTKGMVSRGAHCKPKDKNPFVVCEENGQEREIPSTELLETSLFPSQMRRNSSLLKIYRSKKQDCI